MIRANRFPKMLSYNSLTENARIRLILIVILLVAFLLRVYDLGHESIWMDEAFSVSVAKLDFLGIIKGTAKDLHPPLYYLLLHFWIKLFGISEFTIRFMSVIFGVFTVFMVYKIGAQIFSKDAGLLSALLIALSIFNIFYSQEARMYSLMAMLTLISLYYFIMLFQKRDAGVSIGYIFSTVFLIYTHVYGLFIVIAQNIYVLLLLLVLRKQSKLNFRGWAYLQFLIVLLFSPWIYVLITQIIRIESNFWIPVPHIKKLIGPFITYSGSIPLFLLFVILSFFSILGYKKNEISSSMKNFYDTMKNRLFQLNSAGTGLILIWLLTPIILPFIISQISAPIYVTKYTIGASLAFFILVASGITKISHKIVKSSIVLLIIILSVFNVNKYYSSVKKIEWRNITSFVDSKAIDGDLILFNSGFIQGPFDYYSDRSDLIKEPLYLKKNRKDPENLRELNPILGKQNRFWLILDSMKDPQGIITKNLSMTYNLVYHKDYFRDSYITGKITNSIGVNLFVKEP